MFNEDDSGSVLLLPSNRPVENHPGLSEDEVTEGFTLEEITELMDTFTPGEEVAEPAPAKTLRELLAEAEVPATGQHLLVSNGIRRMREYRVNRTLGIVSDWLLSVMSPSGQEQADGVWTENENLLLLNLAEDVRSEIVWPEREAHQAAIGLADQKQGSGS